MHALTWNIVYMYMHRVEPPPNLQNSKHTHTPIHTHTHTHTHTRIHTHIHTHTHVYTFLATKQHAVVSLLTSS